MLDTMIYNVFTHMVYGAWIILYHRLVYTLVEVKTMDMKRKRELLEAYKNRHPEMGVIMVERPMFLISNV